jgi:uncharacterized membrane protein (DUF485 family)
MQRDAISDRDHRAYQAVREARDFAVLKKRYRNFVVPWTIAFMAWYLLYVACNNWARDFMSHEVVGHINVALIFGLLQFVSTFLIAWLYERHMDNKVDPLAADIRAELEGEAAR